MRHIYSKSGLAMILSGFGGFHRPDLKREQYLMDGEIGASVLWHAYLIGDIKGKVIADLGCGTGILGIGALLLGAKQMFFVDSDARAIKIAQLNISKVNSEDYHLNKFTFVCLDVSKLKIEVNVVLENPPFGTKSKHADILFLDKALEISPIVYSFHKSETLNFLKRYLSKKNVTVTHTWDFKFPLKAAYSFHRRQISRIYVSCLRIVRTL